MPYGALFFLLHYTLMNTEITGMHWLSMFLKRYPFIEFKTLALLLIIIILFFHFLQQPDAVQLVYCASAGGVTVY